MKLNFKVLLFISFLLCHVVDVLGNQKLEFARDLFYKAIKDEAALEEAIQSFDEIKRKEPDQNVLADTYIGSLTAMRALHTIWPQKKYNYAIEGISMMEKALIKNTSNVEALFIYGSTCVNLPFFFGKKDDGEKALKRIIKLVEKNMDTIEPKIIVNALEFILKEIELKEHEIVETNRLIKKYKNLQKEAN